MNRRGKRYLGILLIGILLLVGCGKTDELRKENTSASEKDHDFIIDKAQSMIEPEKIKSKKEFDEALPFASKEIEDSKFEDFKIQILDMLFVLDGSMTLRDVAKELENSRYELQYDLSEGGVVSGDEEYEVRFDDVPLFVIQASQVSEDEKFVDAYDAVLAGIKIKDFSSITSYSESVFLPGGIGVHNGKNIKEICSMLENQGISDIESGSSDEMIHNSTYMYIPNQNVLAIIICGTKVSSFGYYPASTYKLSINNGDGQVEKIELEQIWISENDPYNAPDIKAKNANAKIVKSLDGINKEGLEKCMLETADTILNGSYDGSDNHLVILENLTPYGVAITDDNTIVFVFTTGQSYYAYYSLRVNLYSNGIDYFASFKNSSYGLGTMVSETFAESPAKDIKNLADMVLIESNKTAKKGAPLFYDADETGTENEEDSKNGDNSIESANTSPLEDGRYHTYAGFVTEISQRDGFITISTGRIQDSNENVLDIHSITLPIDSNIEYGDIDADKPFENNSDFETIKYRIDGETQVDGSPGVFWEIKNGKITRLYLMYS